MTRRRPPVHHPCRIPKSVCSWVPDLFEGRQQPAGLLARAHRHTHASRRLVAAVAHQDAALAQGVAYRNRAPPEMAQYEIRRARHVPNPELFEADAKHLAPRQHLRHVTLDVDRKSTRLNSSHLVISYA